MTLLDLALGGEKYDSKFETCYRYNFKSVLSGFWQAQKEIFGSSYAAALSFGVIAVIIGGITTIFVSDFFMVQFFFMFYHSDTHTQC